MREWVWGTLLVLDHMCMEEVEMALERPGSIEAMRPRKLVIEAPRA